MGFTKTATFPILSKQVVDDAESMQKFANLIVERVNTDARKLNATLDALENVTGSTLIIGGNAYTLFRVNENGQLEGKFNPLTGSTISGDVIDEGTIIANKLTENAKGFISSIVFSATDYNTVAWASGNITFADNTAYGVDAGNTGNMTGLTYIYFDRNVSATVLQVTTDADTALGENSRLMCVGKPATNASSGAFFVPAVGVFGVTDINIAANSISTASLQAGSVTAAIINVSQLSAIAADMGTITAGSITSAQYRTSSGAKRFEINYTTANEIVFFEGGAEILKMGSNISGSSPGIGGDAFLYLHGSTSNSAILVERAFTSGGTAIDGKSTGGGVDARGVSGTAQAGGGGVGYGIYGTASGAATNWAGYFDAGNVYIANRLTIAIATGTSPLAITSTTVCTNLNADLLDGSHASAFQAAGSYAVTTNNLSDLSSASTARTNLGLGTIATNNEGEDYTADYVEFGSGLHGQLVFTNGLLTSHSVT